MSSSSNRRVTSSDDRRRDRDRSRSPPNRYGSYNNYNYRRYNNFPYRGNTYGSFNNGRGLYNYNNYNTMSRRPLTSFATPVYNPFIPRNNFNNYNTTPLPITTTGMLPSSTGSSFDVQSMVRHAFDLKCAKEQQQKSAIVSVLAEQLVDNYHEQCNELENTVESFLKKGDSNKVKSKFNLGDILKKKKRKNYHSSDEDDNTDTDSDKSSDEEQDLKSKQKTKKKTNKVVANTSTQQTDQNSSNNTSVTSCSAPSSTSAVAASNANSNEVLLHTLQRTLTDQNRRLDKRMKTMEEGMIKTVTKVVESLSNNNNNNNHLQLSSNVNNRAHYSPTRIVNRDNNEHPYYNSFHNDSCNPCGPPRPPLTLPASLPMANHAYNYTSPTKHKPIFPPIPIQYNVKTTNPNHNVYGSGSSSSSSTILHGSHINVDVMEHKEELDNKEEELQYHDDVIDISSDTDDEFVYAEDKHHTATWHEE